MNTITITLVQTEDGRLVGRTRSDAWNLDSILGSGWTVWADKNSIGAKRLRRRIQKEFGNAFKVTIGRGVVRDIVAEPNRKEVEALGLAVVA
jgi:hypothetical protein